MGSEPWHEVVRRLEKGALVEPAALATALFHELIAVRHRLDEVERKLDQDRSVRPNEVSRGAGEVGLQSPNHLEAAQLNSGGNGSRREIINGHPL